MQYTWRIDPATRLIVVRTDGGPEWTPKTTQYADVVAAVDRTWRDLATPIAERHGLDVEGILAMVVQESRGNARAFRREPNGWTGVGLLQITHPGLKAGHSDEQLFDPALNLETGVRYTAQLAHRYQTDDGLPDWPRVFAAFNAGSARPNPKSPWNLYCYGNHVDAEVAFLNTIILSRIAETQELTQQAVELQFDLVSMLDLSPHHEEPEPPEAA